MPNHRYRPVRQSDEHDFHEHDSVRSGRASEHGDAHSLLVDEPLPNEVDAHIGAKKAEASVRVYGRYSKWILFTSYVRSVWFQNEPVLMRWRTTRLGFASYIYSLDSSTTVNYLSFAASAFHGHALISSVQVSQGIVGERVCLLWTDSSC